GFMDVETNDGSMNGVLVNHLPVADNFIEVLGIEIVAGRNFSPDVATDPRLAMIVNESLVRLMGWKEPIGKRMGIRGRTVIGVVKDFNFKSLHTPVEPLVIYQNNNTAFTNIVPDQRAFKQQFLLLNVATSELRDTLEFIGSTLAQFDPVHPFEYRFIDEALGERYVSEQRLMRLIGVFSGICVFVACLGLFGLATFATARRTKEIGIRKVLGASTAQIVLLLSRRTLVLVILGSVVAWFAAYVTMTEWLGVFAYHTDITPSAFLTATVVVFAVALLTVALQSLKTARMRPVHSLRNE
ncbi:MAG TPA: FtsX-like permease family protein, partial [Vicinamibacterales bacterium]|nr:FtsX-like permease family protein [Vicinamibacterales bacterium]